MIKSYRSIRSWSPSNRLPRGFKLNRGAEQTTDGHANRNAVTRDGLEYAAPSPCDHGPTEAAPEPPRRGGGTETKRGRLKASTSDL
ncbi:hypothetical protein EVAR_97283_1 [Eumeta japonica]|uniref:Uncharacterized protein n=1 Tax=Eumeta variegata TaxID=151549 RepID=A0A4C1XD74_EUMVA|nr:hypothetical protein EVAR_97283_1 [Eumeta japonica]